MIQKTTKKEIELHPIEYNCFGSARIDFFIEKDQKKAQVFLQERFERAADFKDTGQGLTYCRAGRWPVVWLSTKKPHLVTHEMIHAVLHLLSEIGVELKNVDEEIFAYLVDHAVEAVFK